MLFLAGHATRINGKVYEFPTVILLEILQREKVSFYYLRHSIDGRAVSELETWKKGVRVSVRKLPSWPYISVLRYFSELVLTVLVVAWIRAMVGPISFIGIDPLNAVAGVFLRRSRIVHSSVFYSVDYSTTRFPQPWLNSFYLNLDRWAGLQSDAVWNVSTRIQEMRAKTGINSTKNLLVPNVPTTLVRKKTSSRHPHRLITVGILDKQLDFENLFLALPLILKKYPDTELKIIGSGPQESELKKKVQELGLNKRVEFLGFLPHHKVLEYVAESGVGLALYNGAWSFNYYGDSMKCREFFLFGLPVMTTNTHSTVTDIESYGAGTVVIPEVKSYAQAIMEIFSNYEHYAKNSRQLGQKYAGIHETLLRKQL
jgi:glycosyltransferase involved in cell wall biosynthesis